MKNAFALITCAAIIFLSFNLSAQSNKTQDTSSATQNLYMDVHHFGPGKVKFDDVATAHAKDLAIEKKFGVHFINYWVDEAEGNVYCLSTAPNAEAIKKTHAAAHGLLPDDIMLVQSGQASTLNGGTNFFLDFHHLGAGKVTAKDVAAAHKKDLAVENKYGVNFINYWVNEKSGTVVCLSQAPDSTAIINTHKEAHGLVPANVEIVKQGN
jgi:hypothetical protein